MTLIPLYRWLQHPSGTLKIKIWLESTPLIVFPCNWFVLEYWMFPNAELGYQKFHYIWVFFLKPYDGLFLFFFYHQIFHDVRILFLSCTYLSRRRNLQVPILHQRNLLKVPNRFFFSSKLENYWDEGLNIYYLLCEWSRRGHEG